MFVPYVIGGIAMSVETALAEPPTTTVEQRVGEHDVIPATERLAVVVNPSKFDDLDRLKAVVAKACRDAGRDEAVWYETSREDPGEGQARDAVAHGATIVCSLGGDGTVRSVASALIGTEVALGLLPGGTGNLLARNLGLPIDDLPAALDVVLNGTTRKVDVGAVTWDDESEQVFLVMAGMGFDARMMADANERIKNAVGWVAYLLSGVRALFDAGFAARVSTHDQRDRTRRARAVVIGNCGQLTGGLELMPDARLDDGKLDVVLVAPRGVVGWATVLGELVTRRRQGNQDMRRFASDSITVVTDHPILAELDGDAVGPRRRMAARARAGALLVTVPAASKGRES